MGREINIDRILDLGKQVEEGPGDIIKLPVPIPSLEREHSQQNDRLLLDSDRHQGSRISSSRWWRVSGVLQVVTSLSVRFLRRHLDRRYVCGISLV